MEKIDAEELKPRVLRNGKVLWSVEWKKPQRKRRKTNNLAESDSTSAPSDDVATTSSIKPKPPKEEPQDDGTQDIFAPQNVGIVHETTGESLPKRSELSVELTGELNSTKRPRTLRIKVEPVDPQPEIEAFVPKDTTEPLQITGQQLPAAIVPDGRNSNSMQIRKASDASLVGPGCFSNKPAARMSGLQVTIKQESNGAEGDWPSCSSTEQGRVSKINSLTSSVVVEQVSSASIDGGQEKIDTVQEEAYIRPEKVLVSIPIDPNILATIIKQERKDEGQESITECSSNSQRRNKQKHPILGQEQVSKNTTSTVDRIQEKKEKKVPLKRGRNPKMVKLPITSKTATVKENNSSKAAVIANTIEILCPKTGTSQVDEGAAVAMETRQQKEINSLTSGVDFGQISSAFIDGGQEKIDTVQEEACIRPEKVLVSIPIVPNILATIIKQERKDEGHESITECSSNFQRPIKQERPSPVQGRVSKNTTSTVDRTQEKKEKKVPLKRGRKPKKVNLPITFETAAEKENNNSIAATMANRIEILRLSTGTSQADEDAAVTMETNQQPLYVSDTEEILEIADVAELPPKDRTFALQSPGVYSIFDSIQTDHSCYLQLRKPFQRLLVREWFYSNLDQCLLGRGNGAQDMETLLSSQLPALATRQLNRASWNHIRSILRRLSIVKPQRRCSEKFFLDERTLLEQRREKVRFLQAHPMFEYLDDDLPPDLPVGIESGDPVVAKLNEPYGVFRGVVENVGGPSPRSYTVRFEDPAIDGQIVSDINIASATPAGEPIQEAEDEEIVMAPKNLSKQLELLKGKLDEKQKWLNEMEYLRLRFSSIRNQSETELAQDLMQAHQQRYLECIEHLQTTHSAIALFMRKIVRLGLNYVDEPLIDRQVVQIGRRLQEICSKAGNIPLGNGVLEFTLRQLRGSPSCMKELQQYLQNKFAR